AEFASTGSRRRAPRGATGRHGAALWISGPPRAPAGRTSTKVVATAEVVDLPPAGASGSGMGESIPPAVDPGEAEQTRPPAGGPTADGMGRVQECWRKQVGCVPAMFP